MLLDDLKSSQDGDKEMNENQRRMVKDKKIHTASTSLVKKKKKGP